MNWNRSGYERRNYLDRRVIDDQEYKGPERRNGSDRRSVNDRRESHQSDIAPFGSDRGGKDEKKDL
jgi:hypothetical protein